MSEIKFPKGFLWGASTAAHQVEGHQHNNWSVWEPTVAKKLAHDAESRLAEIVPDWPAIKSEAASPDNYVSGVAVDHYTRYEEDITLAKRLGLQSYRFSIEWSRIEPEPGHYNDQELRHYHDMAQACRDHGLEPIVTLHHFTNPLWLEKIGWHHRSAADKFGQYSDRVAKSMGKLANYWITINEPGSYFLMRYFGGGGGWPDWPGVENSLIKGFRYINNVGTAHQRAAAALKKVNPRARVGLSGGLVYWKAGRHDPMTLLAVKVLRYFPDRYILNRNHKHLDFIGMNYYMRVVMKAGLSNPKDWADFTSLPPHNDMGWSIYPEGIYYVSQMLKRYQKPIYIFENGIPNAKDNQREQFIKNHLQQVHRSIRDGADIKGYFYWSLLDNFEWSEGFWPKFGLIAVDRKTMERTIRPSARVYADIAKHGGFKVDEK